MKSFKPKLPKKIPFETYQAARDQIKKYLSKRDDVKALFEVGTVKSPGLSDLDFVVIIADKPDHDIADYLDEMKLPNLVREIMDGGTLIVMRTEDFERIQVWDDIGLSQLLGDKLVPNPIEKSETHFIKFCRLLDWLPERLARMIGHWKYGLNNVKQAESLLFSLRYSLVLIKEFLKLEDPDLTELLSAIITLRNKWFNDQELSYKKLFELYDFAMEVGFDLLISLAEYTKGNSLYGTTKIPEKSSLSLGHGLLFEFSSNYDMEHLIKSSKVSQKRTDMITLPAVFYYHFAIYGLIGGIIGSKALKNITPFPDEVILHSVHPGLLAVQKKRMAVCNSMAEFLSLNVFRRGLFKFGWYYP